MATKRGYGIGLQVFADFIHRNAVYVDKTAYVHKSDEGHVDFGLPQRRGV